MLIAAQITLQIIKQVPHCLLEGLTGRGLAFSAQLRTKFPTEAPVQSLIASYLRSKPGPIGPITGPFLAPVSALPHAGGVTCKQQTEPGAPLDPGAS